MRIAMIGTGYVGLVSGACFSEFGVDVSCVDKDAGKIDRLSRGEIPIYEPGLDQLVAGNAAAGSFRSSVETLAGDATLEVTATGGVPDQLVGILATLPYPLRVRPHRTAFRPELQDRPLFRPMWGK